MFTRGVYNSSFYLVPKYQLGDGCFSEPRIKISSWNVNGLNSIMAAYTLKKYLDSANPDIMCLSEIRIAAPEFYSRQVFCNLPKGYNYYFNFCVSKKGHSGVAVFSKTPPILAKRGIGIKKHDKEGRVLLLEFEKFVLVNTYVPNRGKTLEQLEYRINEWDVDFFNFLKEKRETYKKPFILAGDLNAVSQKMDLLRPPMNSIQKKFNQMESESFNKWVKAHNYQDTFRIKNPEKIGYTYFSSRRFGPEKVTHLASRLDYFLLSPEGNMQGIISSEIREDYKGRDHVPIELVVDLNKL